MFAGSLLEEEDAGLVQNGGDVIQAVGDLLGRHEAVVEVLAEPVGVLEGAADIGVAGSRCLAR